MTATAKLNLELLANAAANQTLANTTFAHLNQLVQAAVVDKDLATPPGSPADEALYIVAASPTGAWAGKAGQLAYWLTSTNAWQFIVPREGFLVHVNDEDAYYKYDGAAWAILATGGGSSTVATQTVSSSGGVLDLSATTAPVILVTLTENITSVTLPSGVSGQSIERRIVFTQAAGNYTIPTTTAAWGGISVDGAGTIPPMGTGAGTVGMYKLTNDNNAGWRMYVDQTGSSGSVSSPVSVISGTTYTGAASDNGKTLVFTNTAAKAATIDPEATTALPSDWELILNNKGASNLTVVAGSGVTISAPAGGSLVIPTGGTCALKRRGADDFFLAGNTL